MKWLNALMKLKEQTRLCKICFEPINDYSLMSLIQTKTTICKKCLNDLVPVLQKFEVLGCHALSIFSYDEVIQKYLYQFKACFDFEIKELFLSRFKKELSVKYSNFIMIPIPSYKYDDETREFNHVVEMFECLHLPMMKIIIKTHKFKQATNKSEKRKEISKHLELSSQPDLTGKKVLIVDDVYTTGSTMKAAIKLVETLHPKTIEVLVMSKTILK